MNRLSSSSRLDQELAHSVNVGSRKPWIGSVLGGLPGAPQDGLWVAHGAAQIQSRPFSTMITLAGGAVSKVMPAAWAWPAMQESAATRSASAYLSMRAPLREVGIHHRPLRPSCFGACSAVARHLDAHIPGHLPVSENPLSFVVIALIPVLSTRNPLQSNAQSFVV